MWYRKPLNRRFSRLLTTVVASLIATAVPAASGTTAASGLADPSGFHIQVPAGGLVVHESAGQAVITVVRGLDESRYGAQVRYITSGDGYDPDTNGPFDCGGKPCTATPYDFMSVKGQLDFLPGQTSATFAVPIIDHGTTSVPKTLRVALFGAASIGLGTVSSTTLTILNDDPVTPPTPGNPLSLPVAPAGGNPLAGARFFVDPESVVANMAKRYPGLRVIASQPGTGPLWHVQLHLSLRARYRDRRVTLPDAGRGAGARDDSPAGYLPARAWGLQQR
jgi:hypothetical protein